MHTASMYVTYARGEGARQAQAFFLRRFDTLFFTVDESLCGTGVVQWHATRARTYDELGDDESSRKATEKLHRILLASEETKEDLASVESRQLGWLSTLLYAAKHAEPDLAAEAISKIDRSKSLSVPQMPVRWDAFLVLSACLPSGKRILPYLERVIDTSAESSFEGWYETESVHAYEFWRVVASRLYGDFRLRSGNEHNRDAEIASIRSIVDLLWNKGVDDIAAILEYSLIRIEIDFLRDFAAAELRSQQLVDRASKTCNREVQVHVLQTRADALRCSDRDANAVEVYKSALAMQPESDWSEEPDFYLLLAISQAKNGHWDDAIESAARSAKLFSVREGGDVPLSRLASAKSFLEAAGFAINADRHSRAAGLLICAYNALQEEHQADPLWAALAQISWSLVNRIKPESSNPQPPFPGFTLNLQESDEATEMQRSAPALMLGRVCTVVGRPYRAIFYFNASILASRDDENRASGAFFGIDAAIEAQEMVVASQYATLSSSWMLNRWEGMEQKAHSFVYDFLIGRTFRIISKQIGVASFDERLGESINQVRLTT